MTMNRVSNYLAAFERFIPDTDPRPSLQSFLEDVGRWPNFPMLPIKRGDWTKDDTNCFGVVYASQRTRVCLKNMYFDSPDAPSIDYPDYDAMANDGWIVD